MFGVICGSAIVILTGIISYKVFIAKKNTENEEVEAFRTNRRVFYEDSSDSLDDDCLRPPRREPRSADLKFKGEII
jgi:hypothetical protein